MPLASRYFNAKQALEKEVKDLYCEISPGVDQAFATATLNLTADIILTSVAAGSARNTNTFTIQVLAAAANPTDTVLVAFTGTAAAIVCTVTPNDGTNNGATPVPLTTAELVELINTGAVVGKTITLTDASGFRNDQTATGGDATDLADGGEGDGVVGTFSGGVDNVDASFVSGYGFASVARSTAGLYTVTLSDAYYSIKNAKAILKWSTAADVHFQVSSEDVDSAKTVAILAMVAATPTDVNSASRILLKVEVKNTSVV